MDNGTNVVKAIQLIKTLHVLCTAHTLHLSVTKGLNATGAFKKYITNLILFFNDSPKNTENLRDAQCKLNYQKVYEVLLNVQTHWNLMYIAWKCLLELKNAILYLITILKISSEKDDKDDASYLEQINLTELEWSLLINMHSDDEIIDLATRANQALNILHDYVQKYKNIPVNFQQNSDS
ncbi:20138_t:CDS:2 [Cetraspora pellucida]|uniref:20138_t:CDS:1 n=1 Tax=Cetraspora pellucida TaxID=1433469 RepID=A0A9N8WBS8_9GLOM|nr:20138_t:CDS:2 [Cetraspora pellucida]